MICIEVQLLSPILLLARISPCSTKKVENSKSLLPFGVSFPAFRDFISSLECSRYSNLKMIAIAFSLLSTLTMIVAVICLLNARCTYTNCVHYRVKATEPFPLCFRQPVSWRLMRVSSDDQPDEGLRQRLGSPNLAISFLVASTRLGGSNEPITFLEFLNADCFGANIRWVIDIAHLFPL